MDRAIARGDRNSQRLGPMAGQVRGRGTGWLTIVPFEVPHLPQRCWLPADVMAPHISALAGLVSHQPPGQPSIER